MMARLLRVAALAMLTAWAGASWAQPAPTKVSPGQIATTDRANNHNRAACEREARELKLSYFQRRQFIKGCIRR
jgi:hypothetical protein